jgi:uncharacterized protein YwqG
MNKKTILDSLKTAGHEALTKDLEALIRPAIFIKGKQLCPAPLDLSGKKSKGKPGLKKYEEALALLRLGDSRFGGLPDLPPGTEWPKRDDVPMEFVAQIRLADVAPFDAEKLLPAQGTLLFFYNSQWNSFDMDGDYNTCRVIFSDVPDEKLVRTKPPTIQWQGEYNDEPRPTPYLHGVASLSFSQIEMPPGGVSPFVTPKSKLGKIWQDFSSNYAQTWSATPRDGTYLENHLLGYIDGDDYVGAHKFKKKDRLLLQVDSDDAAEFQWGDCDRLYFMLTEEQLAARDFSKVRNYSILG